MISTGKSNRSTGPKLATRFGAAVQSRPKEWVQSQCMSAAVGVKNPTVSSDGANGSAPSNGISPNVGLKPQTPQKLAGRITLPSVCVPIVNGTMPAATAAAEPDE